METIRGRVLIAVLGLIVMAGCSGSGERAPVADAGAALGQATATDPSAAPEPEQASQAGSPPITVSPEFRPEAAVGAVPGVPGATNTAPIVAVANYFTELPGIDIASLSPRQRERFLQQVNSEMCPCGCKNDTLARCYVNDPRCPTVKGIVQKVFDEVKSGK